MISLCSRRPKAWVRVYSHPASPEESFPSTDSGRKKANFLSSIPLQLLQSKWSSQNAVGKAGRRGDSGTYDSGLAKSLKSTVEEETDMSEQSCWNDRYESGDAPWDTGYPSTELIRTIK